MDFLTQLDGNILLWIQENLRKEFLNPIVTFITSLGDAGWFWILLCALLLFSRKYRKTGLTGLIALLIGFLITNLWLKNMVMRTRPYELVEGLELIGKKAVDFSFPSGHSTASIAASAVFLAKLPKKFGVPAILLGVLICFTRLYIGIHYPSDVIAGVLIGLFASFAAVFLMNLINKRNEKTDISHLT